MRTHLLLAGLLVLASNSAARAGIVTFANTGGTSENPGNPHSGAGTTYSRTFAATHNAGPNRLYSGGSSTMPPPGCSSICAEILAHEYAEAVIDANGGTGRVYAHRYFESPTQENGFAGFAEAGFRLTDVLTIDHASPFQIRLDLSHSPITAITNHPALFSSAGLEYRLLMSSDNGLDDVEMYILMGKGVSETGSSSGYTIASFVNGEYLTQESGNALPGVYTLSTLLPARALPPGLSSFTYNLELSLYANALCAANAAPGCRASVASINSSHIQLTGAFTSQSGFAFSGDTSAVPEPAAALLVGLPLLLLAIRPRRGLRGIVRRTGER